MLFAFVMATFSEATRHNCFYALFPLDKLSFGGKSQLFGFDFDLVATRVMPQDFYSLIERYTA